MKSKRNRAIWRAKGYKRTASGMYVKNVPCWFCHGYLVILTPHPFDGSPVENECTTCTNGMVEDYVWTDSFDKKLNQK